MARVGTGAEPGAGGGAGARGGAGATSRVVEAVSLVVASGGELVAGRDVASARGGRRSTRRSWGGGRVYEWGVGRRRESEAGRGGCAHVLQRLLLLVGE